MNDGPPASGRGGPPVLPSGWFPDPHRRYDYRWFNGTAWTADVSNDGNRFVDPDGAAPLGRSHKESSGTGNGVAVGALTCGLIGLVFAWMPVLVVVGLTLAVLALVLGIRGLRRSRTTGNGRGMAITGVVSGAAGLALSVVGILLTVTFVHEMTDFLEPGPVTAAIDTCTIDTGEILIDATLTNHSNSTRDYTVYGVVAVPGGVPDIVAHLENVPPDEPTPFTLRRIVVTDETECDARLVVHGPTPYGLEIERVDD